MTEEEIVQKEDNSPESENNQPNDNEEDYPTGDDNKEVNNKSDSSSQDDDNKELNNKSDSSSQDDDNNTQEVIPLSLKDESELFVLSVDGVPRFYTKTIEDAREKMWTYAKSRRIQETHYNTYIRACLDKNRLEILGSNKFSVFMVDRMICRLLISAVQEFETININEQKTFVQTNAPPTTPTTPPRESPPRESPPKESPPVESPPIESPPKRSFFSSFFW